MSQLNSTNDSMVQDDADGTLEEEDAEIALWKANWKLREIETIKLNEKFKIVEQ